MSDKPPHFIVSNLLRARDWQERLELNLLCDWWRKGGRGICALLGIGGAGKTAIIDRFLGQFAGVYFQEEVFTRDYLLESPDSVFVFPFYEYPSADNFFSIFTAWLEGKSESVDRPPYSKTLHLAVGNTHRILIVLDGMEMVQDDGTRGGILGQILDKSLRSFLVAIARGTFQKISVVATSRFPLNDLILNAATAYVPIRVDRLSSEIAVRLLRARGVRVGSESDLVDLARSQGYHALTVDLMGGFIGRYCDGDPSKLSPDPMEEIGEIVATHAIADVDAKAILDQQVRLARLARRYQIALRERDPATLALLERVCLFRLGINSETMVSVFTGESKRMISGHALAQLDENEVNAKLMLLSEMRLLEKTTYGTYTAHPAIRDGFLQGLQDTNSLVSHEAVREGLEVLLGSRPGEEVPSEPRRLDLLEEIVYQTISTGKLDDAWSIYLDRLGGYANLGWRLGNYERGERICREFARRQRPNSANAPENLSQKSHSVLFNEWGLYLCDLGRLTDAEFCYKKGAEIEKTSVGRSICLLNLAEVRLLRGAFRHSVEAARLAVEASSGCSLSVTCLAAQKHIQSMVGKYERGVHAVRASLYYGFGNPKAVPQKVRGFTITPHLSDQVLSLFERRLTEALAFEMSSLRDKAAADLLRSELALAKSDVCSAERHLSKAKNRAVDIDCAEILCWCIVLETKLTFFALENMNLPLLDVESILKKAHTTVNDGLVKARDCGLSAFHIDLLLLRARLHLWNLDINASKRDTFCAIFGLVTAKNEALIFETETLDESSNPEIRGIFPPDGVERPVLLAATHPDCGYQRAVEYAQVLLKMIAETPIGSSCVDSRADTLSRIENNSKPASISGNSDSLNEPSRAEQKSTYSSKQKKDEPIKTPISPNVFISYTHDSTEHADRVLRLSNRLRLDGVESHIDQYSPNPAEGWPVWMLKAIEAADYVVVVSTKRYAEKASESKRSGGRFESVLILQELYELGMNNDRFIPVVFDNLDNEHILKWLKPVNYYDVESDEGYASLLRRLLDDPLVIAPPVGVPVKKGPKTS